MGKPEEIKVKEYFSIIEEFLRDIQSRNVKCIAMVAMIDGDEDTNDVFATYNCTPFDISNCASVMNLHAAIDYIEGREQMMRAEYDGMEMPYPFMEENETQFDEEEDI